MNCGWWQDNSLRVCLVTLSFEVMTIAKPSAKTSLAFVCKDERARAMLKSVPLKEEV